jgi:hypothetical protein
MAFEDPDFSSRAAKGSRGSVPPGIDEIDGFTKLVEFVGFSGETAYSRS